MYSLITLAILFVSFSLVSSIREWWHLRNSRNDQSFFWREIWFGRLSLIAGIIAYAIYWGIWINEEFLLEKYNLSMGILLGILILAGCARVILNERIKNGWTELRKLKSSQRKNPGVEEVKKKGPTKIPCGWDRPNKN